MRTTSATAAAFFAVSLAASGAAAQSGSATPAAKPGEVTIIGCVQLESDYRKANEQGKGGVLGTGVGAGDEFVLVDAAPAARPGVRSPVGTSGTAITAYALTGSLEKELTRSIGRQVEVVGTIDHVVSAQPASPAPKATELPRISITVWHPVADFCPNKK